MRVDIFKARTSASVLRKKRKKKREMIIAAKSHEALIEGFNLYGRDMLAGNAHIVSLYRCISSRFIALNYN